MLIKFIFNKLGLFPRYTAEDVVSGKCTREQYTRNYRTWAGTECCNPPYDERIHGKMPTVFPPAPPKPKKACKCSCCEGDRK